MDKQLLVNAILKIEKDLIDHGFVIEGHRTIPTYVGFRSFPVRLGLVTPNAERPISMDQIQFIVERKRAVLTDEERALIGTILLYPTAEAMNEDMDERMGQHLVVSDW